MARVVLHQVSAKIDAGECDRYCLSRPRNHDDRRLVQTVTIVLDHDL